MTYISKMNNSRAKSLSISPFLIFKSNSASCFKYFNNISSVYFTAFSRAFLL